MPESLGLLSSQERQILSDFQNPTFFADKRILLTGTSGFIARYLLSAIIEICEFGGIKPSQISTLNRQDSKSDEYFAKKGIKSYVVGDHIDSNKLREQYDIIIHAASPASPKLFSSYKSLQDANLGWMLELISKQKSLQSFVYFSAGEVYGTSPNNPILESEVNDDFIDENRRLYPQAKLAAEKKLVELSNDHNFTPKIIRLFHTYGPGIRPNDGRSISDFFWSVAQGVNPQIFTDGSSERTFLFAADMALAVLQIITNPEAAGAYNVGATRSIKIRSFAELISSIGHLSGQIDFVEKKQNFNSSPIHRIVPDTSKIQELGWKEQFTLEEGVLLTLKWVKNQIFGL